MSEEYECENCWALLPRSELANINEDAEDEDDEHLWCATCLKNEFGSGDEDPATDREVLDAHDRKRDANG